MGNIILLIGLPLYTCGRNRLIIDNNLCYFAVPHLDYTVRHFSYLLCMSNDNYSFSVLSYKPFKLYKYLLSRFIVKCTRRLVTKKYLRIFCKRPCDRYSLLLTA